jgi:hypothetical protein
VAPPRVNTSGSEEGHSCPGGSNPLERRCQAERFGKKSAGAEKGTRKSEPITRTEQGSEERSP